MEQVNLQYIPNGVEPVVHVSQNDVGRQFQLKLYDGTAAYSMPSGTTAKVEGVKPDGKAFSYSDAVSVSGNIVTVTTKQQMTIVSGTVTCEIRFVKDSSTIGTLNFKMLVEPSPVNENTDISETVLPEIFALATEQMENAEAWAKGTKNGAAVSSSEEQYHNNAKYWNEQTQAIANESEAWATGKRNGINVDSSDPAYRNNSKYYSEQSASNANAASGSAEAAADSAKLSESWAVGNTNTRTGEDTNNSKYWSRQSEASAAAAATSESNANSAEREAANQALKAEGYATGEQNGVAVQNGTYYHNNAEYYSSKASESEVNAAASKVAAALSEANAAVSEENAANSELNAQLHALDSEAWATGKRNGVDVQSDDDTYENNSKYYADLSDATYQQCLRIITDINAHYAVLRKIMGTLYLNTESDNILTTESGDRLILDF